MSPELPEEKDQVVDVSIKHRAESALKKQELACLGELRKGELVLLYCNMDLGKKFPIPR